MKGWAGPATLVPPARYDIASALHSILALPHRTVPQPQCLPLEETIEAEEGEEGEEVAVPDRRGLS